MDIKTFMADDDFDALVERLHRLTDARHNGTVDRWEFRATLAEFGVLPTRAASAPSMEDSLIASLRAISRRASRHESEFEAA